MSDDLSMSFIADNVEAFPLAQFNCCTLAMPLRWIWLIGGRRTGSAWRVEFSRMRGRTGSSLCAAGRS